MFDKIKQLQEMKQKMEEVKQRLETITATGEAEGGKVKVTVYASKKVKEVIVAPELAASGDAEEIGDLVVIATNRALENAENVAESEMRSVAGGMLGGLGF